MHKTKLEVDGQPEQKTTLGTTSVSQGTQMWKYRLIVFFFCSWFVITVKQHNRIISNKRDRIHITFLSYCSIIDKQPSRNCFCVCSIKSMLC